jgi:poly(hydroxyalkanoate) granule-associated protein
MMGNVTMAALSDATSGNDVPRPRPDLPDGEQAHISQTARRALLTSLGALALSLEEANELLDRLVERGEVMEGDLARLVNEYLSRERAVANGSAVHSESVQLPAEPPRAAERAAGTLAGSVEAILGRLNVPTHADIEALSLKISRLNDKVTALHRQRAALAALTAERTGQPERTEQPAEPPQRSVLG